MRQFLLLKNDVKLTKNEVEKYGFIQAVELSKNCWFSDSFLCGKFKTKKAVTEAMRTEKITTPRVRDLGDYYLVPVLFFIEEEQGEHGYLMRRNTLWSWEYPTLEHAESEGADPK